MLGCLIGIPFFLFFLIAGFLDSVKNGDRSDMACQGGCLLIILFLFWLIFIH